jgi:hypothetical protein
MDKFSCAQQVVRTVRVEIVKHVLVDLYLSQLPALVSAALPTA